MIDREDLMRNNQVFSDSLERQVTVIEIKASTVKAFDKKNNKVVELTYEDIFPLPLIRSRVVEELRLSESVVDGEKVYLGILDESKNLIIRIKGVETPSVRISIEIPGEEVLASTRMINCVHKLQNFIKANTDIDFTNII